MGFWRTIYSSICFSTKYFVTAGPFLYSVRPDPKVSYRKFVVERSPGESTKLHPFYRHQRAIRWCHVLAPAVFEGPPWPNAPPSPPSHPDASEETSPAAAAAAAEPPVAVAEGGPAVRPPSLRYLRPWKGRRCGGLPQGQDMRGGRGYMVCGTIHKNILCSLQNK